MIARVRGAAGAIALATAVMASAVSAQITIGIGTDYMGYTFDEGLGATAAQLISTHSPNMIPFFCAVMMQRFALIPSGPNLIGPSHSCAVGQVKVLSSNTPWSSSSTTGKVASTLAAVWPCPMPLRYKGLFLVTCL